MFRRLFALLMLAVAMALAPLGMPAMAEASPPASAHHGAMAGEGHCQDQPQPASDRGKADKNCCVAMCVAVVVPAGADALPEFHGPSERPAPDRFRLGYLGEIATPPPKRA